MLDKPLAGSAGILLTPHLCVNRVLQAVHQEKSPDQVASIGELGPTDKYDQKVCRCLIEQWHHIEVRGHKLPGPLAVDKSRKLIAGTLLRLTG